MSRSKIAIGLAVSLLVAGTVMALLWYAYLIALYWTAISKMTAS